MIDFVMLFMKFSFWDVTGSSFNPDDFCKFRNKRRAHASLGDCLADDFFRMAETIDWRGIDDINGPIYRGVNGGNRYSSVPIHIQPPMAHVPIAMRENFNAVPGMPTSLRSPRCRQRQHRQDWRLIMRGPPPHTG